jgi:WD40 repeat protein
MAFSPGTSKLLSTSADRCLRVWDPYGRAPVTTLRGHSTEINGLAIARNGRTAYTAAADGALKQWHPLAGPRTDLLPVTASSIHLSGLSADSQTVASVADGTLILTKLGNEHNEASATPTGFTNLPCFPSSIGFSSGLAVVSPNLAWLAVARTNAPLEVWELAHHTRRFWGPPLGSAVHAVFSPDSLFLAFARETNVVLLDVATGTELVASVSCPEGWSWPFRFAGKTNVLGIGCGRRIMLWDTHEQRVLQEVTLKHRAHAICFALSADAQQLAVGYTDNSFTLHDTRTGEQQGQAVPAHLSGVTFLCFSPDGRTLVSTTQRSLKFWNLATRRELAAFELPGMTKAIAFTPDGNNLVAETGGTLCAWRAPSGADIEADQRQRNKTAR